MISTKICKKIQILKIFKFTLYSTSGSMPLSFWVRHRKKEIYLGSYGTVSGVARAIAGERVTHLEGQNEEEN